MLKSSPDSIMKACQQYTPFVNLGKSNVRTFGTSAGGSVKSLTMFLNSLNQTVLSVVGLILLLMLNKTAIVLGLIAVPLVVAYPLMKRLTAVRAPVITPEPEAVSEPWIAMPEEERKNVDLPSLPGDDSLPSQSSGLEVKLEFLQKLAMSDTDRVAEVLRQWITSNERIDNK